MFEIRSDGEVTTMGDMVIRIGLTGGIAAGKSTVARRLERLGALVIDYDALARGAVAPDGEGMRRIAEEFGARAITSDGMLNRSWMADHVFGKRARPGARSRLNAIEHPLIYREASRIELEAMRVGQPTVIVHDVPLLAEVIDTIPFVFAHIVTVEAPESVRVERMVQDRGMSRDQALGRIGGQPTASVRRSVADEVIDATQPIEQMFEHVDKLYAQWASEAQ